MTEAIDKVQPWRCVPFRMKKPTHTHLSVSSNKYSDKKSGRNIEKNDDIYGFCLAGDEKLCLEHEESLGK